VKRITAILLVLAFAVGTVVLPAMHRLQCADAHEGHSSNACVRCQLANAPLAPVATEIEPAAPPQSADPVFASPCLLLAAIPGGSAQARAPPVA
jgi:hypothetical protein